MANTKPKVAKSEGEKKPATHPSSAEMVIEAITKLSAKGGSSLQAIKKYIADLHKVDLQKQGTFIKAALKRAVESGKLIQTTGKGAAGSFKLAVKPKPAKKPATKKKTAAATSPAKKSAAIKTKPSAEPKAAAKPKKPAAANKPTSPTVKPAAAKGKAPKIKLPKTVKANVPAKPKAKK